MKFLLAASFVAAVVVSCNTKPAENPDTDGKDSIETTVDTTSTAPDTTQAPADSTAAKQ